MKKGRHKSSQQISFLGFYHYCSLALYYPKTQWLKNNKHLLSQSFLWIITVDSAWLGASSFFFFLIVSFFFLLCFFPLPFIPHIPSCIFPSTPSGSLSYKVATKVRSGLQVSRLDWERIPFQGHLCGLCQASDFHGLVVVARDISSLPCGLSIKFSLQHSSFFPSEQGVWDRTPRWKKLQSFYNFNQK